MASKIIILQSDSKVFLSCHLMNSGTVDEINVVNVYEAKSILEIAPLLIFAKIVSWGETVLAK